MRKGEVPGEVCSRASGIIVYLRIAILAQFGIWYGHAQGGRGAIECPDANPGLRPIWVMLLSKIVKHGVFLALVKSYSLLASS